MMIMIESACLTVWYCCELELPGCPVCDVFGAGFVAFDEDTGLVQPTSGFSHGGAGGAVAAPTPTTAISAVVSSFAAAVRQCKLVATAALTIKRWTRTPRALAADIATKVALVLDDSLYCGDLVCPRGHTFCQACQQLSHRGISW